MTKISKFIEFTSEQKERAATVVLEEFLLRQGEKLIKSGREKRIASDHSVTVRGCEWFDHAPNEVGEQKPFAPHVPNVNMHRVFAYLLKTRGLDADVVSYFARKKMLYEDAAHHNAVFIGTDKSGSPRHAHLVQHEQHWQAISPERRIQRPALQFSSHQHR